MVARTEAPKLHLLPVLDLLGVTVAPLQRNLRVRVGIYKDIERAVSIQLRQESNRGSNLPKDGLDLVLDLFLRFLRRNLVVPKKISTKSEANWRGEFALWYGILLIGGLFRRAFLRSLIE